MTDLTKTMEITTDEMQAEGQTAAEASINAESKAGVEAGATGTSSTADAKAAEAAAEAKKPSVENDVPPPAYAAAPQEKPLASPAGSGTSTPRPQGIPMRPALMDKSEEDAQMAAAGITQEEKDLRAKEKKKGLSREQREQLAAFELERKKKRDERVATLEKKLIDRISVWTETDKSPDVTHAFQEKTRLHIENLKMESFGLELLHAIGQTYHSKASSFLKSQKFLGIQGFFSRLKDKGNIAKETWGTISTALDAQVTLEEMARAEERGGEDWTDEKKAEYEKRVTGKILAAAWRGSKYEIQGVLREVCDNVLYDKKVKLEKRVERAQALVIIGDMFMKVRSQMQTAWPDKD